MLRIRKDDIEKIVTTGAYEDLYKSMGYEIVPEKNEVKKVAEPAKVTAPEPQTIPSKNEDKKASK